MHRSHPGSKCPGGSTPPPPIRRSPRKLSPRKLCDATEDEEDIIE